MAKLDISIPKLSLSDGNEIPAIGYGTGTAWYKANENDALDDKLIDTTKLAVKLGYHHLDGAAVYQNERELGKAIKDCGVPRESLFVTTKCSGSTLDVTQCLDDSLKKLGLTYVDLYLIHQAFDAKGDKTIIQKAWAQMEAAQAAGKVKSIGVSNFYREHLDAVLETAKVRPVLNQIEFHPYIDNQDLLAYHRNKDIRMAGYSPQAPVTRVPNGPLTPLLEQLAKKYGVSPGDICVRWLLDQNVVAITTSSKEQRMSDTLRVVTFKLTPKEIEDITETGKQHHFRGYWTEELES